MDILKRVKKRKRESVCAAVIAAAGSAERFGSDKLTAPLGGESVLLRTLRAFEQCDAVREIVLVVRADRLEELGALVDAAGLKKVKKLVAGGATRTDSVLAGVSEASRDLPLVAIHDGARPLVTGELIAAAVAEAARSGAAVPVIPVTDTLKTAADGALTGSVDREGTFRVQTPQVFDRDLILAALVNAREKGLALTDDASAVQALGGRVTTVPGSEENLKITTPADLLMARAILEGRSEP